MVDRITNDEVMQLFGHVDTMEELLDEADEQDMLGTEGWRHWFGID